MLVEANHRHPPCLLQLLRRLRHQHLRHRVMAVTSHMSRYLIQVVQNLTYQPERNHPERRLSNAFSHLYLFLHYLGVPFGTIKRDRVPLISCVIVVLEIMDQLILCMKVSQWIQEMDPLNRRHCLHHLLHMLVRQWHNFFC